MRLSICSDNVLMKATYYFALSQLTILYRNTILLDVSQSRQGAWCGTKRRYRPLPGKNTTEQATHNITSRPRKARASRASA